MLSRFKLFYLNLNKKVISSILLIVIFPIITLRLLGLLQSAEWTAYDLLFHLSPPEPKDERIVLVVWDENDLQISLDATMSDLTLGFVLEKIKEQQPRLIGLDLYRDIPVPSRLLSDQQDEEAYNKLQQIFRSTPNLIGIEKVLEPTINPNRILNQQGRVGSSDIITDLDNIVRRSFIDPRPRKNPDDPNTARDATYIGTGLGAMYLAQDGWKADFNQKGSLLLFKEPNQIVLENLKLFDGGYINNKIGLDFLINWRRGASSFTRYSVNDLKSGVVPQDAFYDKIVLLGNISASSADIHYLPTNKWNQEQPWTYGVEIPAQVASSIISAALDGRPLLIVAPWGMGYLLLLAVISTMTWSMFKFSALTTNKLYLISALLGLILTLVVGLASLIAFQTLGWWIPIIPSVLGIWLTFLVINYEVQINKEKNNLSKLKLLTGHLGHEVGNSTNLIKFDSIVIQGKIREIQASIQLIYDYLRSEYEEYQQEDYYPPDSSFSDTTCGIEIHNSLEQLHQIQTQIPQIWQQIAKLSRYTQRTKHYIELTTLSLPTSVEVTNVNELLHKIVTSITEELQKEHSYPILVEQIYDPSLTRTRLTLDKSSLEIILKNLLESAVDAISAKAEAEPNYRPTVRVQTKKSQDSLSITVEDNGQGIPYTLMSRIFDAGFSAKGANKGQGIGLFLVKELLRLEKGTIKVESQWGVGSKFIISLPGKRPALFRRNSYKSRFFDKFLSLFRK